MLQRLLLLGLETPTELPTKALATAKGPHSPFSHWPPPVEVSKDIMAETDLHVYRKLGWLRPEFPFGRAHMRIGTQYPPSRPNPYSAFGPLSMRLLMVLGYLLAPRLI